MSMPEDDAAIINATRSWLEKVVIGRGRELASGSTDLMRTGPGLRPETANLKYFNENSEYCSLRRG